MLRLSNGVFILLKKLRGGCHKEVGAPEMGLCEARGLCPDAPVFFNLFPGIWTGAHPPQENTIPHAFQRSRKNVGQIYLFFCSFFGWPPLTSKFNPSTNLFCNVFNKPITPCIFPHALSLSNPNLCNVGPNLTS